MVDMLHQDLRLTTVQGTHPPESSEAATGDHRAGPQGVKLQPARYPASSGTPASTAGRHENGADDGIRTRDRRLGKPMRYHCATSARCP